MTEDAIVTTPPRSIHQKTVNSSRYAFNKIYDSRDSDIEVSKTEVMPSRKMGAVPSMQAVDKRSAYGG